MLYNTRDILSLTLVNGKPKGKFRDHWNIKELLLEFYFMELVIETLNMDSYDDWPQELPRNIEDMEVCIIIRLYLISMI